LGESLVRQPGGEADAWGLQREPWLGQYVTPLANGKEMQQRKQAKERLGDGEISFHLAG
jgi:hypothetical protein